MEWFALLHHIQELPDSNLSYPDQGFPESLQANAGIIPSISQNCFLMYAFIFINH
jgi:hypothetical protein